MYLSDVGVTAQVLKLNCITSSYESLTLKAFLKPPKHPT